ncbi:MAG: hypothetical protein U0586_16310 [Candidatus Brocadiaceae bacterium]
MINQLLRKKSIIVSSFFILFLTSCASAPQVMGPIPDKGKLSAIKKYPFSVALLMPEDKSVFDFEKGAESFTGGGCPLEMSFGNALAQNSIKVYSHLFQQIVLTTKEDIASSFDFIIIPIIINFQWRSAGPTTDASTISLDVILKKGQQVLWQGQFQHEKNANFYQAGCTGCAKNVAKASILSLNADLESSLIAMNGDSKVQQAFSAALAEVEPLPINSSEQGTCSSGQTIILYDGEILEVPEAEAMYYKQLGLISEYQCK